MSLLTPDEVREHIETGLTDTALQRLIDAEEDEIVYRYGEHQTQTDVFTPYNDAKVLYPTRRVASVTEIKERLQMQYESTETTLSDDDYEVVSNGTRIDRLPTGTNGRTYWGNRVTVTYTPRDETSKRERVLLDLVRLAEGYDYASSHTDGDYKESQKDYQAERERVLSTLGGRRIA